LPKKRLVVKLTSRPPRSGEQVAVLRICTRVTARAVIYEGLISPSAAENAGRHGEKRRGQTTLLR